MKIRIPVIYQDDDLLIVNKPPRFLTVPDRHAHELPNLYRHFGELYGEIFIVHRLDKETSGIICFAKNAEAHRNLCRQFEQREVEKVYLAIVEGVPAEKTGVLNGNIAVHPHIPGKMIVARKGKKSITEYSVVEEFRNHALVAANIKTGRQHQIRVHFNHLGHPLLIDPLYNKKDAFFLSSVKKKYNSRKYEEERPLMTRQTLHAHYLKISHPVTAETMEFRAEPPKDFAAVLKQLQKWGK